MAWMTGRSEMENRIADGSGLWGSDLYEPSGRVRGGNVHETSIEPHRRGCANPACPAMWTVPWKSRRRPIFEGQWGCGPKCLEALIASAVRRESGEGLTEMRTEQHRHRVPLGLVMLAQGWITHPQLQHALESQKSAGAGRIGEWLQRECGVPVEAVTRGLSAQWNCPVLTTEGFDPGAMALIMPRQFVEEFRLVPLKVAGSRVLSIGFEDGLDASAAFSLQQMTDLNIISGLVQGEPLEAARRRLLSAAFVEASRETVRDPEQMTRRIAEMLAERQPVNARLVRLHHSVWLRMWLESGATGKAGTVPVSTEDVVDAVFSVGVQA